MRIAVDAMGGDHAPVAAVSAVWRMARERSDVNFLVFGDESEIRASVQGPAPDNVTLVHTDVRIEADDEPVRAVRRKPQASMVLAARAVREGEADVLISAGNTGAFVASGLLVMGRLPGMERPALAPILPTFDGHGVLLLDAGATVDADARNLLEFAVMGSIYAQQVLGIERPRVALLNIGTEEGKGNAVCKAAYPLLASAPQLHFIGNLESRELLSGDADVVVCDGFVGNVVLKLVEGVGLGLFGALKEAFMAQAWLRVVGLAARGALSSFRDRFDYAEYGGAPLLGVQGGCIKAHGSSDARAWYHALEQAARFAERGVLDRIRSTLVEVREHGSSAPAES
ncbi:MAG: phosphate acyltransferase PlsX [Thermoflavifilum sp.]|nr:phosphate acyltransferase PlsX [Thermoflavifilum sp.]MCL6513334.1 phosphate acyltransferase PlsX [Alicyclobacillus sp.]